MAGLDPHQPIGISGKCAQCRPAGIPGRLQGNPTKQAPRHCAKNSEYDNGWLGFPGGKKLIKRKILIVGDSHIHAIQAALEQDEELPANFQFDALRIKRVKAGQPIGDIHMNDLLSAVGKLTANDVLVLALRGNMYSMMGLMRHPRPFDVIVPRLPSLRTEEYEDLVPYSTLYAHMLSAVERGYGTEALEIARSCRFAAVYFLSCPAPKDDEEHIMHGAETYFKEAGIAETGLSPPALRLKLWEVQQRVLSDFCSKNKLIFLDNPEDARDESGFLKRRYYAGDATHANPRYGSLVLKQVAQAIDRAA